MSARPHAPSQQRIAEARARGHVPRVPLLSLVGGLGLLAVASMQARGVWELLLGLFREPLSDPARGVERAFAILAELRGRLVVSLLGIAALIVLVSWLAQGPAWGAGSKFGKLSVDWTASVLFASALMLLLGMLVFDLRFLELQLDPWPLALLSAGCLVIDIAFARARWFASLWMTRREFLDEQRDQGVSPEIAAARRRARG